MSVSERIMSASGGLSKKQNILGKYVIDNLRDAALMNAPQIARGAGVSEATLTRFIYALGYSGFAEFALDLRRETIEAADAAARFRQEPFRPGGETGREWEAVFDTEIELMRETMRGIDEAAFDEAARLIYESDRLLFVGGPIHHFLSLYAVNFICAYRDNVWAVSQTDMSFISQLSRVGPASAAVVFSFPRYSTEVQRAASMLADRGVGIIAVTDSRLSPIVPLSRVQFITPQRYLIMADANASALALIHSLMVAVFRRNRDKLKKRLDDYERSVLDADMFVYKRYNFANNM